MKLVPRQEFMTSLLTELLEPGESLKFPFYGAILKIGQQNHVCYAYFGLTHSTMLITVVNNWNLSKGEWTTRVPLDIKSIVVKKSRFPSQLVIQIEFHEGNDVWIKTYKKMVFGDIGNQELHIEKFIEHLSSQASKLR